MFPKRCTAKVFQWWISFMLRTFMAGQVLVGSCDLHGGSFRVPIVEDN